MTNQKFKIIAISALATLMTSAALADSFVEFRPGTGRPGMERPGGRDCERAKDNLDRAADIYRSAVSQLQNIGRVCGGNPACILMCGLHGSGKTTSSAKLAKLLTKQGRSVLLVAADVYRPAAMDQLAMLGEKLDHIRRSIMKSGSGNFVIVVEQVHNSSVKQYLVWLVQRQTMC